MDSHVPNKIPSNFVISKLIGYLGTTSQNSGKFAPKLCYFGRKFVLRCFLPLLFMFRTLSKMQLSSSQELTLGGLDYVNRTGEKL